MEVLLKGGEGVDGVAGGGSYVKAWCRCSTLAHPPVPAYGPHTEADSLRTKVVVLNSDHQIFKPSQVFNLHGCLCSEVEELISPPKHVQLIQMQAIHTS